MDSSLSNSTASKRRLTGNNDSLSVVAAHHCANTFDWWSFKKRGLLRKVITQTLSTHFHDLITFFSTTKRLFQRLLWFSCLQNVTSDFAANLADAADCSTVCCRFKLFGFQFVLRLNRLPGKNTANNLQVLQMTTDLTSLKVQFQKHGRQKDFFQGGH